MEVRNQRVRQWGQIFWWLVLAALLVAGIPETLLIKRVRQTQGSDVLNSSNHVLASFFGSQDGAQRFLEAMKTIQPPGALSIQIDRRNFSAEEAALVLMELAWPRKAVVYGADLTPDPNAVALIGMIPNTKPAGAESLGPGVWLERRK